MKMKNYHFPKNISVWRESPALAEFKYALGFSWRPLWAFLSTLKGTGLTKKTGVIMSTRKACLLDNTFPLIRSLFAVIMHLDLRSAQLHSLLDAKPTRRPPSFVFSLVGQEWSTSLLGHAIFTPRGVGVYNQIHIWVQLCLRICAIPSK